MSLRDAIRNKGMKQAEVAARLRVSESSVSNWCQDQRPIPSEYIMELAGMLGVPPERLLPKARCLTSAPEPPVEQQAAA